jgi:hypothetical protein
VLDVDEWEHLPEQVYIPVLGLADDGQAIVQVREMTDRRSALLVYSSLAQLFAGWGEHQQALRVPVDRLPGLRRQLDFHALMLDVEPGSNPLPQQQSLNGPADPVVYVPSQPFTTGQGKVDLELQEVRGVGVALMTYSSQAALRECCGPRQYFVTFPADHLSDVMTQAGADAILIDVPLPQDLRH